MRSLREFFRLDRRCAPRYSTAIDVTFYLWNPVEGKPLTESAPGRLRNISHRGACLETDHVQIGKYHLMRDMDEDGQAVLMLDILPPSVQTPFSFAAKVLSYDRYVERARYQFDVRLEFLHLSDSAQENLGTLIKSAADSQAGNLG